VNSGITPPENKPASFPLMIEPPVTMTEAGQPVLIHSGNFSLIKDGLTIPVNGRITFDWYPFTRISIEGKIKIKNKETYQSVENFGTHEVVINGHKFGDCSISSVATDSEKSSIKIKGKLYENNGLGDKSIKVDLIRFSIPNLSELWGSVVTKISKNTEFNFVSRVVFENDNHVITIDKQHNYSQLHESLLTKGGCVILYAGELKNKTGLITYNEAKKNLECFEKFLDLLNGRKISILFMTGYLNENKVWTDYSPHSVTSYNNVARWVCRHSNDGFNELYNEFLKLWDDDNDKNFLSFAMHWYVEANSNSGYTEGSIILSQVALELIYNYLIIEKNNLLIGKDANGISAANKIRLLLSHLQIENKVPAKLTNLKQYIDSNPDITDAPEALTQIRNALVHSELKKRSKINNIDFDVINDTLDLSLWYIEMSLLFILKYKGKHINRTSNYNLEKVPWVKEKVENE